MSIVKRSKDVFGPWSDFFDIDRFFTNGWATKMQSVPSVNIKETDEGFNIELAAAGLEKDDFKIKVEEDVLTISAEKKEEKNEEKENYTRREYSYNSFSRSFSLPENVNGEKAEANYKNGVLSIHFPKKAIETAKNARQIAVS